MANPVLTAESKVENAIAAALEAYAPLSDWTVLVDQPLDVSLEDGQLPALIVRTLNTEHDNSFEPGAQTLHDGRIDIEAVVAEPGVSNAKRAKEGLAHCLAALAEDRTLGGMLQDLQEVDSANTDAQQRDVGAVSLQWNAQYLTSRSNWFIVLGLGGATF